MYVIAHDWRAIKTNLRERLTLKIYLLVTTPYGNFTFFFYGLPCQALVSKTEHSFNNFSIYEAVISHFHIISFHI